MVWLLSVFLPTRLFASPCQASEVSWAGLLSSGFQSEPPARSALEKSDDPWEMGETVVTLWEWSNSEVLQLSFSVSCNEKLERPTVDQLF